MQVPRVLPGIVGLAVEAGRPIGRIEVRHILAIRVELAGLGHKMVDRLAVDPMHPCRNNGVRHQPGPDGKDFDLVCPELAVHELHKPADDRRAASLLLHGEAVICDRRNNIVSHRFSAFCSWRF
jgi:hypothetical protein